MAVEIKICGVTSVELASECASLVEYIGVVIFPRSPRHLVMERAREIVKEVERSSCRSVVLTVNPSDNELEDISRQVAPDFVQFHGSETPDQLREVSARFDFGVFKAVSVGGVRDLDRIADYQQVSHRVILDSLPTATDMPGGVGESFDWSLIRAAKVATPYMLAGGLRPDNVAGAIKTSGATGVDVSSGVEKTLGVKSVDKIKRFVSAVRDTSLA